MYKSHTSLPYYSTQLGPLLLLLLLLRAGKLEFGVFFLQGWVVLANLTWLQHLFTVLYSIDFQLLFLQLQYLGCNPKLC